MSFVTRDYIATALGISRKRLSELNFKKQIVLPNPIYKIRSTFQYARKDAEDFIKSDPINNLISISNEVIRPGIDNNMAREFLLKSAFKKEKTFADLLRKHGAYKAKTVTVHLIER